MLNGTWAKWGLMLVGWASGALLASGCVANKLGGYLVDYAIMQVVN